MERALSQWISPRTVSGSTLASVAVHGFLCALVVGVMSTGFFKSQAPLGDVTLDYEMLDEPPAPVKEVKPMARVREPVVPVEKQVPVKAAAQELQDDKSDVAGTQKAAAPQAAAGSESNGSATATPYYKIKPKYPRAALVAGDEGWVMLKVDVTESGEVENIRVVDGEKRNLFQDEARRAVSKWKYKPFTDSSGRPIRKADHPVRVEFKLQDAT